MIEFASVIEKAHLVDPAGNAVEQTIEHRTDPLTSTVASINAALSEKAFDAAWQEGRAMDWERAAVYALDEPDLEPD